MAWSSRNASRTVPRPTPCLLYTSPAGGSSANAGTSTPAASTPASGGIEPIELTIYSPGNENSVPTKTIIEYARLVNEASDGAITLDVHHSNELGSDAESIESTRMGTIDLIFAGTSGFTSFYEKAKVLDLPFLFDSAEQAYEMCIRDRPSFWQPLPSPTRPAWPLTRLWPT